MELHPILCCSELWWSSHPIFCWPLKFIPFCVPVSCEILPTLFSAGYEVAQSLSIDLWSSFHLMLQHSVMIFHPLFQWALKFFSSPVPLRCEVLLILCSELWSSFICCSSQLCSFSHSVFQWAVEPGFICQYFNMQGKKQPVYLSVCLWWW